MKRINIYIILLILFGSTAYAQESFRIMTYNILNYPSKLAASRHPYFKVIINTVNPDILIVQEMENFTGVDRFLVNVLDTNYYSAGGFIDGYDTDNALFYKHSKFNFIDNTPILTPLRNISQLKMVHLESNDTLLLYSAHLKASSGTTNEQKRLNEVIRLREVTDQLPLGSQYILVGDLNLYTSDEPAFKKLIDKSASGYFLDPISRSGNWHDNSIFRALHTQSTRTENLPDEGSTGGLDDRFDMILISQAVKDSGGFTYIKGSYETFANDGNHFNKAMNELPNAAVGDEIALALYNASDHLPVYADFIYEPLTSISSPSDDKIPVNVNLYQNYPNPFNPSTTIKYSIPFTSRPYSYQGEGLVSLKIYDLLGREITTLVSQQQNPGNYKVTWNTNSNGEHVPSGIYVYVLRVAGRSYSKKMILLK